MSDNRETITQQIPSLRRYARALTRDFTAADDLVQECLTRALSKIHLWQPGTDLRAWMFTILHNQYVNQVRRSVRTGTSVTITEMETDLTSAPNQDRRLELRDVERALAALPEEQRSTLSLVGIEGCRYEEAAVAFNVPVGTIRSRISRARQALRQALDPEAAPRRLPEPTRSTEVRRAVRRTTSAPLHRGGRVASLRTRGAGSDPGMARHRHIR
jgi:RNA polymerase sigma-70 factor, ECF subfamily